MWLWYTVLIIYTFINFPDNTNINDNKFTLDSSLSVHIYMMAFTEHSHPHFFLLIMNLFKFRFMESLSIYLRIILFSAV